MKVRIDLQGTVPMVHHNVRLADPTDKYTVRVAELASKRGKTVEDMVTLMYTEARGGAWETDSGTLGTPSSHLRQSITQAARGSKTGKKVEQGLTFNYDQSVVELRLPPNMTAVDADDFCGQRENILYVPVGIRGNKVMRARPLIPMGWEASYEMELDTRVLDLHRLKEYLDDAGERIGMGDWRPGKSGGQYGKFVVVQLATL